MKKIDAKKNNPMIAEFMGYKLITPEMRRHPAEWKYNYWENPDVPIKVLGEENTLSYDCSWADLMRVVDKIESTNRINDNEYYPYMVTIWKNCCLISDGNNGDEIIRVYAENKIEAVYKSVVDFIEWYNNNEKK